MWRELLCVSFCPRACEMRVSRLLTSLWSPQGPAFSSHSAFQRQMARGDEDAFTNHFGVTTNVSFFSAEDMEPFAPVHLCACVFIKRMSRSPDTSWILLLVYCNWMTIERTQSHCKTNRMISGCFYEGEILKHLRKDEVEDKIWTATAFELVVLTWGKSIIKGHTCQGYTPVL